MAATDTRALLADSPWPDTPSSRTALGPVPGSASARSIAELAQPGRLLLVITADTSSALALERELPFFLPQETEILAFPDWETLPYDNFSPHQDIISERLRTLHRLPQMRDGILLVPVPTLMHRLPPTEYIAGSSLVLERDQSLDLAEFRRNLERNGYLSVETVYEHGEFALRGSLFDIFPMGSELPEKGAKSAPSFMVIALKDPIGANLDRIQIVKGWIDAGGNAQERVYDVAVSGDRTIDEDGRCRTPVGNTVKVHEATWTNTIGAPELTAAWTDPDFDAGQRAFYYARVIDIPTPRWTSYDALRFGLELPPEVDMYTQERVYTSPIWYTP